MNLKRKSTKYVRCGYLGKGETGLGKQSLLFGNLVVNNSDVKIIPQLVAE